MNKEERIKWSKRLEQWGPFFAISCTLVGALLGSFLVYIFQGEFPFEVVEAAIAVTVILTVFQIIKRKRKKDKLPEADERVARNVFRLFAYTSYAFLGVLFVALGIFTLVGNESIPILYLWIFFLSYIWVVGLGGIIVHKR